MRAFSCTNIALQQCQAFTLHYMSSEAFRREVGTYLDFQCRVFDYQRDLTNAGINYSGPATATERYLHSNGNSSSSSSRTRRALELSSLSSSLAAAAAGAD